MEENLKDEKEKLIKDKIIKQEIQEMMQLKGIKQMVWDTLTLEKGYKIDDIIVDPQFNIEIDKKPISVSIDFAVEINSLKTIIIRCTSSALESWERYIIAFSRAVEDYQIPFAVITDGENAKILDTINNKLLGNKLSELFNRETALTLIKDYKRISYNPERLEREKRIIYAFEAIKCPVVKPEK
jgi:hypothetical protein